MVLCVAVFSIFAEDKTYISPLLINYGYVSLDEQHYHNAGAGFVWNWGDLDPHLTQERNSFELSAFYNSFIFTDDKNDDYSDLYHKVNITAVRKIKRHFILGSLSSASNEPVYFGGLRTAKTGLGYGYELIRNANVSLTLGAIAWVGDFGIEMENGSPWPVMPVPIILFGFTSTWFNAYFEFFAEPLITVTIAPEKPVRLTSTFRMDHYRDIQDLYFDVTLWYEGDFAGIGLGFKNDGIGFVFGEKDKSYETNCYSAYAIVDLPFVQMSGGYVFMGRETFNGDIRNNVGDGFFVSVQRAWNLD
jgi:hypothetical protein